MYKGICSEEDFGDEITPTIFTLKGDNNKWIKRVKHREEAENAKRAGELGIGPTIYHIETCIHREKKPKFSINQQRQRARGISIPEDEIMYDVKEKESHFMVMEKIKGHELRKEEVDEKIDEIYEKYSTLFENGIYLLDMARQNTLIDDTDRVYLIDYEFLDQSDNPEKLSKQYLRDFLFNQKLHQNRSRSRSRGGKKQRKTYKKTNKNTRKFKKCLA
jgi:hypothetical protein